MHSEVIGSEISKAEKHLCQENKRCIDSMNFFLLFPNNARLRVYLLLHVNNAKFLSINLPDFFAN